jgi:hypothetical protein
MVGLKITAKSTTGLIKSCLLKLPYANALILPHNIDLMHQELNVAESIISMCFDVTSFSKDNINARKNLADLCNRSWMEPKINAKENLKGTHVPYCLKPVERKEILMWLKKLKFLYCYASNIKRAVNISTDKLNGWKSHDYHITPCVPKCLPCLTFYVNFDHLLY